MRGRCFLWVVAASLLLGLMAVGQTVNKSDSNDDSQDPMHWGYPLDWSSRYLVMSGVRPEDALKAGDRDPRYVYNMVKRQVAIDNLRHWLPIARDPEPTRSSKPKIDWSVSMEKGYVPQNQFPAKYQFNVSAENCNTDYLLLGLTLGTGASKQATIVGINNLYTGGTIACNSGTPWVSFAYYTVTQTNGQIKTSPALSANGTKVAFVESTPSGSYFHVLVLPNPIPVPPSQTGTVLSPQIPTSCTTTTTVGCMTTLAIQTSASDSNSPPWVDYNTDTAYVGADNGMLYKITPVFGGGAPALVNDSSNWPVTVSTQTSKILTAPVVDDTAGLIFIGDSEGYLYSVKLNSPAKTFAAQYTVGWAGNGAGTGVVDPPIAVTDISNPGTDQVFAFTGCSYILGVGGAVTQLPANFTTGPSSQNNPGNTVNLGSATGDGDCTGNNVHSGTFDNAFWVNGSASGHFIACGFENGVGTTTNPAVPPEMYFFPFVSNTISSTGSSSFLINSNKGQECSPLTEFYNGTNDMLFWGVGVSTSQSYLESSTISSTGLATPTCSTTATSTCVTAPDALGGTSGIVIDNQVSNGGTNIYFTTLAGGSVNGQSCHVTNGTTTPYCAVKLTQSGLQ
jgi:hypothetical protein